MVALLNTETTRDAANVENMVANWSIWICVNFLQINVSIPVQMVKADQFSHVSPYSIHKYVQENSQTRNCKKIQNCFQVRNSCHSFPVFPLHPPSSSQVSHFQFSGVSLFVTLWHFKFVTLSLDSLLLKNNIFFSPDSMVMFTADVERWELNQKNATFFLQFFLLKKISVANKSLFCKQILLFAAKYVLAN